MKSLAIFGSTGMTGLCTTEAALKQGWNVKALVRDPTRLPQRLRNRVDVVEGNVVNYKDVLKTIQNTDAVVVTLGTRNDLKATTDLSEGVKNIVRAMKESNVDVISVCLSYYMFDELKSQLPAIYKNIDDEHRRMFDVLKESDRKFIAVFPPWITDQPESTYKVAHNKSLGEYVSKYDLARFLIESLKQPEHYGQVVGIISK